MAIECPKCQTLNPDTATNCDQCGTGIAGRCRTVETEDPPKPGTAWRKIVLWSGLIAAILFIALIRDRASDTHEATAASESAKKPIRSEIIDCSQQPLHPKCRPVQRPSPADASISDSSTSGTSLSATGLFKAYKANEVAADLKYKGQRISVFGTIESIGKDILDTPYVSLETGEFGSVQCMFPKSSESVLASLSKGKQITIKGTCAGKLMNVILRDCSFF